MKTKISEILNIKTLCYCVEETIAERLIQAEDQKSAENIWREYTNSIAIEFVEHQNKIVPGSNTYQSVFKFVCEEEGEETVYVKIIGYYMSHFGMEYQGFEFVTPKQKVVTLFEPV